MYTRRERRIGKQHGRTGLDLVVPGIAHVKAAHIRDQISGAGADLAGHGLKIPLKC